MAIDCFRMRRFEYLPVFIEKNPRAFHAPLMGEKDGFANEVDIAAFDFTGIAARTVILKDTSCKL